MLCGSNYPEINSGIKVTKTKIMQKSQIINNYVFDR